MEILATVLSVISGLSAVCAIATFFFARSAGSRSSGAKDGALSADIQYIKRRVDDVLLEQKDTNKTLDAHAERIACVEEAVKQAHKRIDEHIKKGG